MTTPIFDYEKSIQVILYIANRLERKDFHKIFKLIFFADRDHLSKYGRVITGDTYIAMQAGPVPTRIYDIFKTLRGDSFYADQSHRFSSFFEVRDGYFLEPKMDADLDYLSESDIEVLDDLLERYSTMSWGEIKEISHDFAWQSSSRDGAILLSDIMLESGDGAEYIDFISSHIQLQKACQ